MNHLRRFLFVLSSLLLLSAANLLSQETTAGLQGTVKDQTGAVIAGAQVVVKAEVLVGEKQTTSDSAGYFRFANLPPGSYTVTVKAPGFATYKNEGIELATGHLPTLDVAMQVGGTESIVEVSGAAPVIDVTTNHTMTNVTENVISDVPHGRSYQSVIQFAPSARNEPLQGSTASNGSGGAPPGSATNGNAYGYSVGGASDAENSYLVEGQATANLIGGYSKTNVPFDFIQEVQIKSSGIEAEHGGALGGVVNVIMRKGGDRYHGSVFAQLETDGMDGSPQEYHRYDPNGTLQAPGVTGGTSPWAQAYMDNSTQMYQPIREHRSDVFPGFTFGGPIIKNRIFGFVGFNPEWTAQERFINYPACDPTAATSIPRPCLNEVPNAGARVPFSRNTQTYYTTGRLDAVVTQKLRLFGSWLYQYQRQTGVSLPASDPTNPCTTLTACAPGTLVNSDWANEPSTNPHSVGYTAPNQTLNFGVDLTINPHLVSTTRLGYYFENYHDFGYPTSNTLFLWETNGVGATGWDNQALPASLQQPQFKQTDPYSQFYTRFDANSALQFNQDLAFFKSGWLGTHNFKFGYQLNRLQNKISQTYSEPDVQLFVGQQSYGVLTATGAANCVNQYVWTPVSPATTPPTAQDCAGQFGYATVSDFGTGGDVTSFNHGLFAQDAWTIGRGVTLNLGVRFDKEYLPASTTAQLKSDPIQFGWGAKVAPRIGIAWDVFRDGKLKLFGDYGKFFDIMKLNVAISSFGGQYWNDCIYTLDTSNLSTIVPALNSAGRFCAGKDATDTATGAVWAGGNPPAGMTFIENVNQRTFPTTCATCSLTSTGVVPNLKPFNQHEAVAGFDYALGKNFGLEVRYDRRRIDAIIEDSAIYNPAFGNETFVIGNPGMGVERTFNSFYNFLYDPANNPSFVQPPCTGNGCVPQHMVPAARSYDGVEFRLTKTHSRYAGMFSYTYSRLRGNYTGLTSSDVSDGQLGGRSSPNNSRAFDEPYFQYNSFGGSSSGLLPTDRPNTFKGYGYYELNWLKKFATDFGLFQYLYSGTPMSSYLDTGAGSGFYAVYAWNRGKWVDVSQDPTTGVVNISAPRTQRTPWYMQTDFSVEQKFKITESKTLSFVVNATNLFNQRSVTAFNADITSWDNSAATQYLTLPATSPSALCTRGTATDPQCYIANGDYFYSAAMQPYNVQTLMNDRRGSCGSTTTGCISSAVNSSYGKPLYFQLARNVRLGLKFTF